jgi:hypothetical protein
LAIERALSRSVRGLSQSLSSERGLIPSSRSLSITVSRPGAVRTPCLALWSHFRYQAKPLQGYHIARWRSPTLRWMLNGVILTEHSNADSLACWTRSKGAKCQQDLHGTWHCPKLVQLRWHLILGMLGTESASFR